MLFANSVANSQLRSNNAILSVKYNFSYITDTLFRNKVYSEKMILFFNNSQSKFLSYDKMIEDSTELVKMDSMMQTGKIGYTGQKKNRIPTIIHKFFNSDTLNILQEYLTKFFLVKNIQPPVKWEIQSDKKNILGYICQKAQCFLKGRNYEVWFANQIPIAAGPWKLSGLPGIILEAKDAKAEVVFLCTEIAQINYSNDLLKIPSQVNITTRKELDEIIEYYTNNPIEALKAVIGDNDFSVKIASSSSKIPSKRVVKKPNNPIELSEN